MSCQKCHRFVCKCEPTIVIAAAPVAPEGQQDDPYRTPLAKELHEAITEGRRTCERALAVLAEQPAAPPVVQHAGQSHPYHRDLAGLNEFIDGMCAGDPKSMALVQSAWYRCMARNHPSNQATPSPAVDAASDLPALLARLRAARDKTTGEPRHMYNEVCDRLDVLISYLATKGASNG